MKNKIIGLTLLIALQTGVTSAGVWAPTAHSRANCFGNNESITWMRAFLQLAS